jgi:hypothetical protein
MSLPRLPLLCGALVLIVSTLTAEAAVTPRSRDGLWQYVAEEVVARGEGARVLFPSAYRVVALDVSAFQSLTALAPMELTQSGTPDPVMSLPMPDGTYADFSIEESPIVTPDLAELLPGVRTYRGRGITDPTATARLDFTPEGFHGFVLSEAGTVYIDPYRRGDTTTYMTYWRRDYPRSGEPFSCGAADVKDTARPVQVTSADRDRVAAHVANGTVLRTYRLAIAATGEYVTFFGGLVTAAQAAMVTTMNRVNGIYEREVAVRMVMVNNTSICFTNAATDPYANTWADIDVNQGVIDAAIGSANYDMGHLFGTGAGGTAGVSICDAQSKARGLTGGSSPIGDAFDVDYVAHEMGHQFGANHTFNGSTNACGPNRNPESAYEPGSGSTIMSYAGICGGEDLQLHSDPYFHARSYDQILANIMFTATCAVQTGTGNNAPSVSAGPGITIPAATPFYLTGSGSDPDGDPLTFAWEEFDLGFQSPPSTDAGLRPIFRSFNPTASPVRTFPKLSTLIANAAEFGESLPTSTRTMTFRLTARDNRAGGGGVNHASTTVSVTNTAGPFVVTAPNSIGVWAGGSTQSVTWEVANTTAAPVSCANVKLLLSTDGGNTFPTTLLASTANDGAEPITVPNVATSQARVRVECATAPFFDISNASFTINANVTVVATAATATSVAVTWTAVSGAASYDVYRRAAGSSYIKIGSSATNSYNDTTAAPDTAYLYAVRSIDGSNVTSPLSTGDLATTVIFTDPAIVLSSTKVKTVHVTQLRTAVAAVRALAGLGAYSFTDAVLNAGAAAKAVHVAELRSALDAARSTLGLSANVYVDAPLAAGVVVRGTHVNDVRNGVK